jgi:mannosyltransferase OCH1-like enzyme
MKSIKKNNSKKNKLKNTIKNKNKIIIHQIFGLLGDIKMNDLFNKSSEKFQKFCKKNNYKYMLWTPKMCDKLIKEYPNYKKMYYSVKYSIMKVDIIRFIILHKYGGLYADLDIYPNIDKLKQHKFIVSEQNDKRKLIEMEVLQSDKNNPLLLNYLDYVKSQIKQKQKIDIYKQWKMRYVYQTTGPFSLKRFINNKPDIEKYIINVPKNYKNNISLNLKGNEDFISMPSCSYKDKM